MNREQAVVLATLLVRYSEGQLNKYVDCGLKIPKKVSKAHEKAVKLLNCLEEQGC